MPDLIYFVPFKCISTISYLNIVCNERNELFENILYAKMFTFLLMIDGVNSMIIALYNTYNKFKCSSTKSNLYYTMNTFYNNTTMIIYRMVLKFQFIKAN